MWSFRLNLNIRLKAQNRWKQFYEFKRAVQLRFQEIVDLKEFEPKLQKLLDDDVVAMPAEVVVELFNINDPEALQAIVKEVGVSGLTGSRQRNFIVAELRILERS